MCMDKAQIADLPNSLIRDSWYLALVSLILWRCPQSPLSQLTSRIFFLSACTKAKITQFMQRERQEQKLAGRFIVLDDARDGDVERARAAMEQEDRDREAHEKNEQAKLKHKKQDTIHDLVVYSPQFENTWKNPIQYYTTTQWPSCQQFVTHNFCTWTWTYSQEDTHWTCLASFDLRSTLWVLLWDDEILWCLCWILFTVLFCMFSNPICRSWQTSNREHTSEYNH